MGSKVSDNLRASKYNFLVLHYQMRLLFIKFSCFPSPKQQRKASAHSTESQVWQYTSRLLCWEKQRLLCVLQ